MRGEEYMPTDKQYNGQLIEEYQRAVKHMRGEEYNMPTDIQFKDDLRKEEIRIENELELLENKEYDKLKKKLERDLKRVRESLQD